MSVLTLALTKEDLLMSLDTCNYGVEEWGIFLEVLEEHHRGKRSRRRPGNGREYSWGYSLITPLYGLYRYVGLQRVCFSAVFVINGVSILSISVTNRVWFLPS